MAHCHAHMALIDVAMPTAPCRAAILGTLRPALTRARALCSAQLDNQMLHGQLPNATLRLCDFGFSKSSDQSVCKSMCGTPEYMAPEVLFEQQVGAASTLAPCMRHFSKERWRRARFI